MRSKFSTTEGSTAGLPETVLVATILRPHGIKGEVTVALWSDNDRRFTPGVEFQASAPAVASRPGGRPAIARRERLLRVERATPHKGGLRIAFAGVEDREAAESLRGLELWVPLASVPEAPAGSYYIFELIGCRCFDERHSEAGGSVEIGTVVDVHEDGGGTLLEVERDGVRAVLPFVEAFLLGVDRETRRIDLRLPEGLLATCAYRS
ncbi:MAG: ribosome maturation factor RimM [Thermoanaerobaculia bacterium]